MTLPQSNVMLVPGAKRASAAGLMSEVEEGKVWGKAEGVGTPAVWAKAEVLARRGGAPAVTVRWAEVVVSKNAVMVTDVLFHGERGDREARRRLATWNTDNAGPRALTHY